MGSKVRRRYTASGSLCRTALPQATTTTSQPSNMTCISTISKSHFESDDFGLLGSDDEAHVAPSGRGDVKLVTHTLRIWLLISMRTFHDLRTIDDTYCRSDGLDLF